MSPVLDQKYTAWRTESAAAPNWSVTVSRVEVVVSTWANAAGRKSQNAEKPFHRSTSPQKCEVANVADYT